MAWKKSNPEVVSRFTAALPDDPAIEVKKMFGYTACFVNGNFFIGLHEDNIVARLPGALREKFPEMANADAFDPMKNGRGMKDWWLIPASLASDGTQLRSLVCAMFEEIKLMPAKEPKRPY